MDNIGEAISNMIASSNNQYKPALKNVIQFGKAMLNKYYNKTDQSQLYQIAMGELILCYRFILAKTSIIQYFTPPSSWGTSVCRMASWMGWDCKADHL